MVGEHSATSWLSYPRRNGERDRGRDGGGVAFNAQAMLHRPFGGQRTCLQSVTLVAYIFRFSLLTLNKIHNNIFADNVAEVVLL